MEQKDILEFPVNLIDDESSSSHHLFTCHRKTNTAGSRMSFLLIADLREKAWDLRRARRGGWGAEVVVTRLPSVQSRDKG